MKIADCMTTEVEIVAPDQTIRDAAKLMLSADAGSMPICDGKRLLGMVTDRDIAIRAVAEGRGPDTPVTDIMTDNLLYCYDDQDVTEVARQMSEQQVRRLPVVDRNKDLVGIVSLGDLSGEAASLALEGVTAGGGSQQS
ncbi:MAG: CBS domain-containing protein [Pseudomonadota bacterium]|nr:CBS domain-containing protein [Pseudomonadota bacterium]